VGLVCVCVSDFQINKPQMQSLQICGGVSHDNWARFDGAKQDTAREQKNDVRPRRTRKI
jgi:hypothetical protein